MPKGYIMPIRYEPRSTREVLGTGKQSEWYPPSPVFRLRSAVSRQQFFQLLQRIHRHLAHKALAHVHRRLAVQHRAV